MWAEEKGRRPASERELEWTRVEGINGDGEVVGGAGWTGGWAGHEMLELRRELRREWAGAGEQSCRVDVALRGPASMADDTGPRTQRGRDNWGIKGIKVFQDQQHR